MDGIKSVGITLFFVLLLTSNIGIIMEGLLVVFPPSTGYGFTGNTKAKTLDLDIGTLAVAADKMNVFYIGVDNPITVAASGINNQNLSIGITGGKITTKGKGHYTVSCNRPGKASLKITNSQTGTSKTVDFRVKRIPDPIVRLGRQTGGGMGSGEFKAQLGLRAELDNFDMDINCTIQAYDLYYVCKRCDPLELKGTGGRFTGQIARVISLAKPGDQYSFTSVKVRCPGDVVGRRINGLSFKIR